MVRRILQLAGGVFVLATVLTAQGPPFVVDQSAPTDPGPIPFTHAVGGPSEQVLSQTVTAGVDGRLREVRVPMGCGSGEVVLEIRDVNAEGQPGPTLYRSLSFDAGDFPVPVTDEFRSMRITGRPVRFAPGDMFAISLSNPTGSCGVWPGPVGDPYTGGTGWADPNDGPMVPLSLGTGRDDLPFQTVMMTR